MVAETRENMTKMVDSLNEGFRSAFDAGQRTQEACFKTMREGWKRPAEFDRFFNRGERIMKEWGPFVGKTMDAVAQTCDANFKAGLDVFQAGCEATTKSEDGDVYRTTRQLWDAAFDAARTNFDTLAKVGARAIENCSSFYGSVLCDETTCKASPAKPAKVGG